MAEPIMLDTLSSTIGVDEAAAMLREIVHGPIITMRVVNEDNTIVWEHEANTSLCGKQLQQWVNGIEWDDFNVRSLITADPTGLRVITYRRINGRLQWTGEEPIYETVDLVLL